MKWITVGCGALVCATLAAPGAVLAAPLYNLTVVGDAGSRANDINALGQMVGYQRIASGGDAEIRAYYYDGSTATDLSPLVGLGSVAERLNDSGTIVGLVQPGSSSRSAFAYAAGAVLALPLSGYSEASGINNAGTIVGGTTFPSPDGGFKAYTYGNGVLTDLGVTDGGYQSYAAAINNAGHAAGTAVLEPAGGAERPFFYSDGVMHDLGTFGGNYGHSWSINNHDQVVGEIGAPLLNGNTQSIYPRHAFLYDGGVVTDLGAMLFGGDSTARDINDLGQIVGATDTAQGRQAFVYATGGMVLLDALIDPALGWTVQEANGINELGQIAGTACKAGLCYAVRLDLATAVPEPAGVLLLAVGLLALTVARRARHSARLLLAT
jgi:probable HAF family extracellular repeat protein